jgi:hypothetical protein
MTASRAQSPQSPPKGSHRAAGTLSIGILAGSAVLALLLLSVSFAALAIAFPLVSSIAGQYDLAISPNDMRMAEQFSGLWWLFATFAIASLAAAVLVVLKTSAYLERRNAYTPQP